MKTMKTKLIALALLALGTVQAQATVLLSESFDDVSALPGAGWQVFNDGTPGGSTTWFQGNPGIFGSHEGAEDSYVAANYLAGPSPAGPEDFISLFLTAPELMLSDGDTISFWTRGEAESPFADVLLVGLLGQDEPWLAVNPTADYGSYPGEWTQYTAVVAGLGAGPRPTRFSFVYYGYVDDLNYIGIDSVEVNHVPEPGTLMLLGLGLAGLGFARRRNVA
jgi:hypothetical protein